MRALLIDGHPDADRLSAHLLDLYTTALPAGTEVERIAIRDLRFDPDLRRGYRELPPLEPDLDAALAAVEACDHLVLAFPLWWGAEPARVKGFWDRILLRPHGARIAARKQGDARCDTRHASGWRC